MQPQPTRSGQQFREDGPQTGTAALAELTPAQADRKPASINTPARNEPDQTSPAIEAQANLLIVLDGQGRIVQLNRACEKLTGYSLSQMKGQHLWSLPFLGENVQPIKNAFENFSQGAQPEDCKAHWTTSDGIRLSINWTYTIIPDDLGQPLYLVCSGLNHTPYSRAEEELKETQTILRAITEGTTDAIFVKDLQGRYLFINSAGARFLGKPVEEITGKFDTELYPPETARQFMEDDRKVITTGETQIFEGIATAPGITQSYLVSKGVYRDPQGKVIGLIGISHDITERKRAEEALHKEQEFLKAVLENVEDGIVTCDAEGVLTLFNRATREFHGLPEQPITADRWAEYYNLYLPDGKTLMKKEEVPLFRALQGETVHEVEMVIAPKNAPARTVMVNGRALFDANGEKLGAVVVMHDITEHKLAEAERLQFIREQEARKEAEEANRLKDEFLAMLSHELRTPLSSIIGWAHLLNNGNLDQNKQSLALETIERNANAQKQLINDLLDVSRIITGKFSLEARLLKPGPIVEAAINAVRPLAEAKSIQLRYSLDQQAGLISGDPERLQQIIWNLLTNAIKFTPQGGLVEVRMERSGEQLQISVSDTGQGISKEFLPHVFDRFRQADCTTAREYKGLGLGLAIVRYLVDLHGGTVQAQSPGRGLGATFMVKLPLLNTGIQHGRDASEKMSGNSASLYRPTLLSDVRVLLVDDDEDTCTVLKIMLQRCGAEVRIANSAREAFAAIQSWRADVILSDIGMPGEDGYSLIDRVRALAPEAGGQTPAIALTAYAKEEDRERTLSSGFQMHLSKPVEPVDLIRAIANLSGRPVQV